MTLALDRAIVDVKVRDFCGSRAFLRGLDSFVSPLTEDDLPPHRLHQLATSFAWNTSDNTTHKRLLAGCHELVRLWEARKEHDDEQQLYVFLLIKLGLGAEINRLIRQEQQRTSDIQSAINNETTDEQRKQRKRRDERQIRESNEAVDVYQRVLKRMNELQINHSDVDKNIWLDQLQRDMKLDDDAIKRWAPDIRLRLAVAALEAITVLRESASLRTKIHERGGAMTW